MLKKVVGVAALLVVAAVGQAAAQDTRAEIGVNLGWTFSDGVSGDPFLAPNLEVYDRLDPKDSFNWGLNVGVPVGRNLEVGFMFGQQMSALVADGTTETEVGDLTVSSYHGYVGYNVGEFDMPVRPYFLFGLGATSYGSVPFTTSGGVDREVEGFTGFSSTWGLGVKGYGSGNFGFKAGIQWTPTYIKSDAEGYWCDPWWGCYVIGDAQYSNQWTFNGGLLMRF